MTAQNLLLVGCGAAPYSERGTPGVASYFELGAPGAAPYSERGIAGAAPYSDVGGNDGDIDADAYSETRFVSGSKRAEAISRGTSSKVVVPEVKDGARNVKVSTPSQSEQRLTRVPFARHADDYDDNPDKNEKPTSDSTSNGRNCDEDA